MTNVAKSIQLKRDSSGNVPLYILTILHVLSSENYSKTVTAMMPDFRSGDNLIFQELEND